MLKRFLHNGFLKNNLYLLLIALLLWSISIFTAIQQQPSIATKQFANTIQQQINKSQKHEQRASDGVNKEFQNGLFAFFNISIAPN